MNAQAAVVAAAGAGAGTTTVAEVESNDTLGGLQVVSANPALVKGTLAALDTDFFHMTLLAGRTLTPPSMADYDL